MLKRAGGFEACELKSHAASASAHHQPLMGMMREGHYISDLPQYGATGFSLSAGVVYAGIFCAARDLVIDRLAVKVLTAAETGVEARLGIYGCTDDMYPGELLLDGGKVLVDETGSRFVEVERELGRGYYFLSVLSEGSVNCRYIRVAQSPLGLYAAFNNIYSGYSASGEWGPLPQNFPEGGSASNVVRMVGARLKKTL